MPAIIVLHLAEENKFIFELPRDSADPAAINAIDRVMARNGFALFTLTDIEHDESGQVTRLETRLENRLSASDV